MAVNEGTRMDGQFLVMSLVPDVCKSPVVPVPYPIVGYLNQSILVSPNVRARGVPMFHMGSRVSTVVGDEAGVGGGVTSQVFKGMCRPVVPVPTVRINGQMHNHHQQSLMLMNCAGPDGPCNTLGQVRFIGPMFNADVGPGGTIPADSNPPAEAESIVEGENMPKLDSLPGSSSGLEDIVGLAQTAYSLGTTDWSSPGGVLGAMGGVAGMAGMGSLSQAANLASGAAGLATANWSNPGSAMGAAMGVAGPMLGGASGGGGGGSAPSNGMDVIHENGSDIPIARTRSGQSGPKLPAGLVGRF